MRSKGEALRKRILLNHARKMAKLKKRFRDIRRRKNKARNGKNKAKQIAERIFINGEYSRNIAIHRKIRGLSRSKEKSFCKSYKSGTNSSGCYCCSFVYYDKI